ncbi:cytoplasmic tRNA 2-thiolation protein 2-A isoform X2 [Cephus cinctus]|uniref:Cytoplasmic tRNA 2-thiolation protein 2 n=1 Tax=Cephus cinctus TaxID=211228 RepID=A0AAJ7BFN7_CEPCN|nr:cytoplasmic tRNA 2-thiolation protein 2-A isoform X2 [Cephus cinctus]
MCSVNDDGYEDGEQFMPKTEIAVTEAAICKKCANNKGNVILRGKDVYCKVCFLASSTHKFRATLGKSKIVRPTDSILIAHSGKAGSTALLHLIKAGMHESVHKRLIFKTTVLHIDEGAVNGETLEERKSRINAICEQTQNLEFQGYITSLDQSISESEPNIHTMESLEICSHGDKMLTDLLNTLSNYTTKQELLHKLRQRLFVLVAKKLGCNKVFVGDNATDLAIRILSNISVGRGAHLPFDVGFIDNRCPDIMILRPMRDFTRKELVYYLNFNNLQIIHSPELTTKKDQYVSIQKLTEKFVTDLDLNFCGTVSTVLRTGDKLYTEVGNNSDNPCILCNMPLDTTVFDTEISAIQATMFSRFVSLQGPQRKYNTNDVSKIKINEQNEENRRKNDNCCSCNDTGCCSSNKSVKLSYKDVEKYLCYGCRLIFQDANSLNMLPPFMMALQSLSMVIVASRSHLR